MTSFENKGISQSDNNVENMPESIFQLEERLIKPRGIEDPNEKVCVTMQLMQLMLV